MVLSINERTDPITRSIPIITRPTDKLRYIVVYLTTDQLDSKAYGNLHYNCRLFQSKYLKINYRQISNLSWI